MRTEPSPAIYLKPLRILRFLCIVLAAGLYQSSAFALESLQIAFLNKKDDYKIELSGNKSMQQVIEKEITQQRQTNQSLKERLRRDKYAYFESQLINDRLRAEGYYAAKVKFNLQTDHILYRVETGPAYRIEKVTLQLPESIQLPEGIISVKPGDILHAETILANKKSLTNYASANHCLYRVDSNYRVLVAHETRSAQVIFTLEDSPSVKFGTISFEGLKSIEEHYLRDRLPFKQGDCFRRVQVDTARLTLIQTNLLASVTASISAPENALVPIVFNVVERHHRTMSAGIGFQSDEGFGVSAGWEHRNLSHEAETLSIKAHIAEFAQTLKSNLTVPHFHRPDQSVTLFIDAERENTDAFKSQTGSTGIKLSRKLSSHLKASIGTELAFSNIKEDNKEENFSLLSFPLSLEYDKRNDPLDPRSGWAIAGQISPYRDISDSDTKFIKSTLAASLYFSFENAFWRPTLAFRSAIGSISGIGRDQAPANVRFYVGGGGSVRGYPFQTLGPLTDNKPDGGLSFNEFSVETRFRWGESWGGVFFIDGGFAYEDKLPEIGKDLLWGAGFGVRYYTSFAPIRFDIAIPLDKREAIDDSFQIYISIGQAF